MYIKNILKAFAPETKVIYMIGLTVIPELNTVEAVLNNGLVTYQTIENNIIVEDNTLIIKVNSNL